MSEIDDLINGAKRLSYDPSWMSEERNDYIRELLNALSNDSREIKSELSQIKKDSYDVVDRKKEGFDFDARILDLIVWNKQGADALKIVDIIDAFDELWHWNTENINNFVMVDEADETITNIAKRFSSYADSFKNLYMKQATEYLRKNKKIPDYKVILKLCFCKHLKRYMETYIKNMKFSEEECRESFPQIQEQLKEQGLDLEASDNIKESFIKLCREKYPLAKKHYDNLFNQKNFRNACVEYLIKSLDRDLPKEFDAIVEGCREDIKADKDIPEEDFPLMEFVNIPINTILSINELIDKGEWEDWVIAYYFLSAAELFEKDHNRKIKQSSKKKEKTQENSSITANRILPEKTKSSWKNALTEDENKLIKQAVSYLNLKEDEESVIKYITKLKLKDLPLKFHDLKSLFDLKDIPPKTESILIDQLWFEYEIEDELLKVKEEERVEQEEKTELIENEEIEIDNPIQYLIYRSNELWYVVDNEQLVRKQLEEFLLNENYATVFKNLLKKPEFLKVFLHKWGHSAARVIRIWMTGWRILFEKKRDGKIHMLYIANHNNYENRLAMIKNRKKW